MISLRRIYAVVRRLRQSLGFGVHSPYVYALLTDVFRERLPYYAYGEIERLSGGSARVDKLLFRLVNRFRPESIVGLGAGSAQRLECMAKAKPDVRCHVADAFSSGLFTCLLGEGEKIGFLYLSPAEALQGVCEEALPLTDERSVFIIDGIHATSERRMEWKALENDRRTGITFDLYDVGLVFFDLARPRRNYRMMF